MSRYTFPPINLNSPVEPQLTYRAHWVGYILITISSVDTGLRWKLVRGKRAFVLDSLLEVDMKLTALLEEIGERIDKEQLDRMIAERTIAREAAELAAGLEGEIAADQESEQTSERTA